MPDFDSIEIPSSSEASAIAPTDKEGCFLVFFQDVGFKYLNLLPEASWTDAASFTGSISPEFGILHHGHGDSNWVSFVEVPPKSWACYQLADTAELSGRMTALPGDIKAVCGAGEGLAALALATGQVRFVDLTTGKACGKGVKLKEASTSNSMCLARLRPRRVALVRQAPSLELEFFVLELDEMNAIKVECRGSLRTRPTHVLESIAFAGADTTENAGRIAGKDQILLCWRKPELTNGVKNGKKHSAAVERHFAVAKLHDRDRPVPFVSPGGADMATQGWHAVSGYFAEWWHGEGAMHFRLRDARFGLVAAAGEVTLSAGNLLLSTSDRFTVATVGGAFVAVRWSLPRFTLRALAGQAEGAGDSAPEKKRKRELSPAEVAKLARQCRGEQRVDVALLRSSVAPEDLPQLLKTVCAWLGLRQDLASCVKSPQLPALVRLLKALADGFLPSLVKLSPDLLEKALPAMPKMMRHVDMDPAFFCSEYIQSRTTCSFGSTLPHHSLK